MNNLPLSPVDQAQQLKKSMTQRIYCRSAVTGEITLPAVPGMVEEYVSLCDDLFARLGREFSAEERIHVRTVLETQLAEAYSMSPRSSIVISYNAPIGLTLNYQISAQWWSLPDTYENWISTREPPLFGTEPDARVWELANEAADPATHRILDVGAGTGRNTLPLARRGHPVDAVEMTPKFADMIRSEADQESLEVRVIVRDIFSAADELRRDYQLIVVSEVVSDFQTTQQLRNLFELAAQCLAPSGRLVLNTFVTHGDYIPDQTAREFGQHVYSCMFTRREISAAVAGLPLELVADDSVYEYEKAHLPAGAWPPTGWYADWASGLDVFPVGREMSPMELRWLVFKKRS